MVKDGFVEQAAIEGPPDSQPQETPREYVEGVGLSRKDIRRNMTCLIMLDAIWSTGAADFAIALSPLLVFLNASNKMIGLASGGVTGIALIGLFASPWITRRFRVKKWYLVVTNVPAVAPIGVIGFVVVISRYLGASDTWLVFFVTAMMLTYNFFGGFVALPHQEYVAACIPASHRGRYNGFSNSIGSITGIVSAALGGLVLLNYSKPMAFGYLFLMTWFFYQGGYIAAAFARERPTPVEKSPKPWSKGMFKALWDDVPYFRFMLFYIAITLIMPVLTFVPVYGYDDLRMAPATAALIQMITMLIRIPSAAVAGLLVDRLGPKRLLPYWPVFICTSLLPVILVRSPYAVYISIGLFTLFTSLMGAVMAVLAFGLPRPENRAGHYTMQLLVSYGVSSIGYLSMGCLFDLLPFRSSFIIVFVLVACVFPLVKWVASTLSSDIKGYS